MAGITKTVITIRAKDALPTIKRMQAGEITPLPAATEWSRLLSNAA